MDLNSLNVIAPAPAKTEHDNRFYDIEPREFMGLAPMNRDAHLRSMKHSTRHDMGKDLRLVLRTRDLRDDATIEHGIVFPSFNCVELAYQLADEVVFRPDIAPNKEYILKSNFREAGKLVDRTVQQLPDPVGGIMSALSKGRGRKLDL